MIYEWADVPYLGVDTPDNSVGGVYRPVRVSSAPECRLMLSYRKRIYVRLQLVSWRSWPRLARMPTREQRPDS